MSEQNIPMKFSEMSLEQQNIILRAMLEHHYNRVRELMITLEAERSNGRSEHYGTTIMNDRDRLMNRLMVDLIYSDMGPAQNDTTAQMYIYCQLTGELGY